MGKVLRCKTTSTNSSKNTGASSRTSSTGSTTQSRQISMYEKMEKSASDIQSNVKSLLLIGKMSYTDDETGEQSRKNDEEALRDGVKDFVSDYNTVYSALNDLSGTTNSTLQKLLNSVVSSNTTALKEIGLTVSKSGELSLDGDALENADINQIKELFAKEGGFADDISAKMKNVETSAAMSLNTLDNLYGTDSTYNKYGTSSSYYNSSYYDSSYYNSSWYI